ncbi:ergothioneine biosynthesis protein EgtB [Allosphingosinicella flava]|uniref:Ergothioneine biosynthesis protein EgtB n=1 Tax=Allosphingosinicella flava TaxID=2771430 RepID=A0A7T2LLQ4_9SPHN|nr:ergothioneine biosynthesis protein EgtB [Sphingosinicella flava]QPQ54623.1 ergothioneine biosynthesis protein EgtB [Sphingosinicella flava]
MATHPRTHFENDRLSGDFGATRALSSAIAAPLSDADATIQPMPDASPAKWHLAHTTWFFETFVLRDHVPGYRVFDARWPFLFNSYYNGEGDRHARPRRGMLSRPALDEVLAYRDHVDAALAGALPDLPSEALILVELGIHHEQQHQELMLMDMKAAFAENPLAPAMWPASPQCSGEGRNPVSQDGAAGLRPSPEHINWIEGRSGLAHIGHDGRGFAFDCEGPRHPLLLAHHALADRLVTNGEWQDFMADGGYARSEYWLSDGWAWVQAEGAAAPLYWREGAGGWQRFGLDGLQPVDPAEPVCHISYYEADAYARWAGARLPTEGEWEAAAATLDPGAGNQLDAAGPVRPLAATGSGLRQMFGDVWEWTMSAYLPYPGFKPAEGTVGEYNGKFMCGQFVLKGASCATPRGHSRASYRNFFYPHQRWMFSGLRLAKSL